jgi:hypothetical protein
MVTQLANIKVKAALIQKNKRVKSSFVGEYGITVRGQLFEKAGAE